MTATKTSGFDRAQVLAPLVIGVTGHRDLREEDRPRLENKLKEIFLKLRKDYSATPLILVSALAEGADRLAAKVALAPDVGVRLVVPLPMPIELYEQDFENVSVLETPRETLIVEKDSRQEFRALLVKAELVFDLDPVDGVDWDAVANGGVERDRQYESVGKYIAQQSQILIALWDGVESGRVGGTSEVVRLQSEGVPKLDPCALEASEGLPVYHVLTPRVKNPFPQGQVLHLQKIYPKVFEGNDERAEKYYRKMFGRLDEFNRRVSDVSHRLAEKIARSKKYLLQDMPEDELPDGMESALNRYAVADALAIGFQQKLFWAQIFLHGFTLGAFVCFLFFVHSHDHPHGYIEASWILVLCIIGLRILSGKLALDTQHEDYRAMAEGLRVKFFWKVAGITDSVAEHYLGKQRSELDWIRNGFRGWNVAEGREESEKSRFQTPSDLRNRLGIVRKYWIDDQQEYFRGAADRNENYHEAIEWTGLASIVGVAILGIVLLVFGVRHHDTHLDGVAIGLEALLALAAILHHFNNRLAFAERAKQYGRMASLFGHASKLLGKFLEAEDYENAAQCVKKIGNEALTENGDWVLLRRERPLEVPHP